MAINPKEIRWADFPKAIKLCKEQEEKFGKTDEYRAKKYAEMRVQIEKAKKKLEKAIGVTKSIKMVAVAGEEPKSFYQKFIEGNQAGVTLAWLGDKLTMESISGNIAEDKDVDLNVDEVEIKYDFVDRTKKVGWDLLNGKGISNGLVTACAVFGISEVLAQGLTSHLLAKGIMKESMSMGLVGLGQLGLEYLPGALTALKTGLATLWGASSLGVIFAGSLAALVVVPAVKHIVDKVRSKHKNSVDFENNLKDLESGSELSV